MTNNKITRTMRALIIVTILLLIYSCSNEDPLDNPNSSPKKMLRTNCYTFIDGVDGTTMDSVFARLSVMRPSGVPLSHEGYSNSLGELCFEYEGDAFGFFSAKEYYVLFGCHRAPPLSSTIIMQPFSYLIIKLKNVEPIVEWEGLELTFQGATCNETTLYFSHSVIDTVFTQPLSPGNSDMWWRTVKDGGVYSEYTEKQIFANPRDTVFVDIEF